MSAALESAAPIDVGVPQTSAARRIPSRDALLWPVLVSVANAFAFYAVRPNVGDLQAALARQSAAADGVGLTYWFQWFGGGASPGSYSFISPYLSSVFGAALVGVLATIAITPLVRRAARGTAHPVAATWAATFTAGCNIWSGRIPFALGCAVALLAVIAVRSRRTALAVLTAVAATLCSPVSGAFLALGLAAAFLVERSYRRLILWVVGSCGIVLLAIGVIFGNPGVQGYPVLSAVTTAVSALLLLLARPTPALRVALVVTAVAAPLLVIIPNGLGSNFERWAWICLPVAVVATCAQPVRWKLALAIVPALGLCATPMVLDLVRSDAPAASAGYYRSLIGDLRGLPDLRNYRLEVVENPTVHTAAYALVGHVALAGGYETQAQHSLNGILTDPTRLNATSYKVWLDNNAVGYVAVNRDSDAGTAEYRLLIHHHLPYLTRVVHDSKWTLYRVANPTPIVAPPQRLLRATQAALTIEVPCACRFPVRVRYSKFLQATPEGHGRPGQVRDDGTGWTTVRTYRPGRYVLRGSVTGPLH